MTPEEWAAGVIRVREAVTLRATFHEVEIGGRVVYSVSARESAEAYASGLRKSVADLVRNAVAEALNSGMPGVPLSAGELEAIRGRASRATAGPWLVGQADMALHQHACDGGCHNVCRDDGADITSPCAGLSPADAAFVAGARQDVPALLSHIDHMDALFRDLAQDRRPNAVDAYRAAYEAGRNESAVMLRRLFPCMESAGYCLFCEEYWSAPHLPTCPLALALDLPRQ